MKKLTKWWILSIACLAVSGIAIGCGDNDNEENKGTGGTGGIAGSGGTGGHAGHAGSGGTAGTGGTGGTAGSGGTGGTGGTVVELSTVSGKVMMNPIATMAGTPEPELGNLHVRIVDAVKALNGEDGIVGEGDTASDGSFTLTDVDLTANTLGFVITVTGDDIADSTMGFCKPGSTIPQLTCGDRTNVNALVVPSAFVTELESAGKLDQPLLAKGFVLGATVTPTMQPIEGVTINGATADEIIFLNPDFTKADTDVTTASGSFVVKPTGVMTLVPDKDGLVFTPDEQQVGATPNVVFQMIFIGTPAP